MQLDMSKPPLKMRAVKAALDNALSGRKKDEGAKHFLAAERAHKKMAEAKTNRNSIPLFMALGEVRNKSQCPARGLAGTQLVSVEKSSVLVQIRGIIVSEFDQTLMIVERHPAIAKSNQTALAQVPKNAVHVDSAKTQRIS